MRDDLILPDSMNAGKALPDLLPFELNASQRILVYGQATLTRALEACYLEKIRVVILKQLQVPVLEDCNAMEVSAGQEVLQRMVLLQGTLTMRNYVYASSVIILHRLRAGVQARILEGSTPLGEILADSRVETAREMLSCGEEKAGHLRPLLGLDPDATLISRTYQMIVGGRPAILVEEKFPKTLFSEDDLLESETDRSKAVNAAGAV